MSFSNAELVELDTLDLRLQVACRKVDQFIQFRLLKGHRNQADQDAAFASGASKKKWPTGNHNSLPSRAMDVVATYMENGEKIDYSDTHAQARLIGYFESVFDQMGVKIRLGMDWDMDWRSVGPDPTESFNDMYHIELAEP